jgi:hypothetical protein
MLINLWEAQLLEVGGGAGDTGFDSDSDCDCLCVDILVAEGKPFCAEAKLATEGLIEETAKCTTTQGT